MGLNSLNTPAKDLYLLLNGQKTGPLSLDQVRALFQENKLTRATPLWYPGLLNWVTVGDIPEFNRRTSSGPPPLPPGTQSAALWVHHQNQVVAMTVDQVKSLVEAKKFRRSDYAYETSVKAWVRADQHSLLSKIFGPQMAIPDPESSKP